MNEFVTLNSQAGKLSYITMYLIPALEFTLGQSKFIPMGQRWWAVTYGMKVPHNE